MSFLLRRAKVKATNVLRRFRECYWYLKEFPYEHSFKKGSPEEIKSLLVVQEGAVGDTYNLIGVLNQLVEDYPKLNIYCLTRDKTKSFFKNPKIHVIPLKTAEEMINAKKFDALVTYGGLGNFFKDKKIVKSIPYRANKPCPWKVRKVTAEIIPMIKTLGFKIDKVKFHFTEEGEKASEDFYKDKQPPTIIMHVGSGKTIRALKEGRVPSHLWPAENWVKVADYLIDRYNCTLAFTGVDEEMSLVEDVIKKIKDQRNVINLCGKYSIEEIASIAQRAKFVIGIDSGMIQILSQVGIPVVILFAGNPKVSAPHSNFIPVWNSRVCNNCKKYFCPENNAVCITKISVEDALNNLPGEQC